MFYRVVGLLLGSSAIYFGLLGVDGLDGQMLLIGAIFVAYGLGGQKMLDKFSPKLGKNIFDKNDNKDKEEA